jgi:hypothetical protein
MSYPEELLSCVAMTEPSCFQSRRSRFSAYMLAQIALLLCIPIWTRGQEIEALLLGCIWTIGSLWFCGSQPVLSIDAASRMIRRSRSVFTLTLYTGTYSIYDEDSVYLILRLDGEDRKGRHMLYLRKRTKDVYLLDLDCDYFGQSSVLLARIQAIAGLLRIKGLGYQ